MVSNKQLSVQTLKNLCNLSIVFAVFQIEFQLRIFDVKPKHVRKYNTNQGQSRILKKKSTAVKSLNERFLMYEGTFALIKMVLKTNKEGSM